MAISEENDLIGYDPLAWLEGGVDKSEELLLEVASDDKPVGSEPKGSELSRTKESPLSDNEIRIINDYPEDLVEETEENIILADLNDTEQSITDEDQFVMDEIEDAVMEEMTNDCDDLAGSETDETGTVSDFSSEEAAGSQIDLDATLTIQNVGKLYEKLKNSLAIHDEIEINASDVASIDTATLQLLVSLKKDADKLQKQVSIIYPSPRFVESAQLLGLLDVLDVDGF